MEFRQIEAFCALAEWGSFSEAARRLYITQPTVSSHILALEKELNAKLVDRRTKPVTLTQEGKRFYEYAESILRMMERAAKEFGREGSEIRLGASSIPSVYIIPELLSAFRQVDPQVSFDILRDDSAGVISGIRAGSVDIGITGMPLTDEGCCCKAIYRDEMMLVTPATPYFKSLREEGASVIRLLQEPYIMREDGSGTKKEASDFLETLGIEQAYLNIAARINDTECIKRCIVGGLGISILSKKAAYDIENQGRALLFSLAEHGIYRSYYLIYRKSRISGGRMGAFIEFAERYWKNRPEGE